MTTADWFPGRCFYIIRTKLAGVVRWTVDMAGQRWIPHDIWGTYMVEEVVEMIPHLTTADDSPKKNVEGWGLRASPPAVGAFFVFVLFLSRNNM